ncbi:hypothetical protein [Herpetosiphon giganteus]|uniref:hypothetical protein n=1 Tax=Herpetosiphon giganteus TaxID=2029754 RepID=UPI0019574F51|nr:hypothetical protein [Herpetosiphon giganteus]MBM7844869.1 hypothetical protein [Herpetosiphon giganteus]
MRRSVCYQLIVLLLGLSACGTTPAQHPTTTSLPAETPAILAAAVTPEARDYPLLSAYQQAIDAALSAKPPVLTLASLDSQQAMAQIVALNEPKLQSQFVEQNGIPFRNEVFGVVPVRESDIIEATAQCLQVSCYRVEIYNFALNLTLAITVDISNQKVIVVERLANSQPDIPEHLTAVAREIASNATEVEQVLGYKPSSDQAVMANTKTSLNATRCERSLHLCVAPTFVEGERALWAIVDLTDTRLVGVRWTNVGATGPAVTEKGMQNEAVLKYCDHTTSLERDGWAFDYMLTSSDGLRISEVSYQGKPLFKSAKLVDWHVSYSERDGFGYSDAVGCPYFSQAAVIAVEPPMIGELIENDQVVGFQLVQEFWSELWPEPCNYYYEQAFQFYFDGRFRPAIASVGRGCGDDGTYRPVTRISLADTGTISAWDGTQWQTWETEQWQDAATRQIHPDGAEYRLDFANGGSYTIATGRGQFADGGRGDQAFLYATLDHPERDEGESDMVTIGPCCNNDANQGPEQFIDNPAESISNQNIVLWYVAQLKNDDTPGSQYCWAESVLRRGVYVPEEYPCWSGPLFRPERGK